MDNINQTIINVQNGNVTGKSSNDKVILLGNFLSSDSSYVDNVSIVINKEKGDSLKIETPYTGYNLYLFLGDFTGDGRDEIMLNGSYGGSGGYAIAAIYKYKDNKLKEIFNPEMFSKIYPLYAKYLDNYKVQVLSPKTMERFIFDISKADIPILDIIYDKNATVKPNIQPYISAVNDAFPIRIDDKYYLLIRQRVIGINNSNTIGYIEMYVSLENDDINVLQSGSYTFGEKFTRY